MKWAIGLLLLAAVSLCLAQRRNFAGLVNGATCTASSFSFGAECWRALDSRETNGVDEWISFREGSGAWINIEFASAGMINEVRFLQRCPPEDHSRDIRIEFQDGSVVTTSLTCGALNMSCEGIVWERVVFQPKFTERVNISISTACSDGGFTGFREITALGSIVTEIENEANLVLAVLGGTCESSSNENADHTCDHAIDGLLGSDVSESWASSIGDVVGASIKLSLPAESRVSKLRLMNKCLGSQQTRRINVELDEGILQEYTLACPGGLDDFDCPQVAWDEIGLGNVRTTGMTITALEGCWSNVTNVGFQEVEILGTSEGDQSCPFDFDQQPTLSSCYKFVSASEDQVGLEAARDVCSSFHPNAHLVEINNLAEQDYVARTAEALRLSGSFCSMYYTDGYLDSGVWRWFSSGSQVVLPFWATGAPSTGDYIAAAYAVGAGPRDQFTWESTDGLANNCFVCEIFTGLSAQRNLFRSNV